MKSGYFIKATNEPITHIRIVDRGAMKRTTFNIFKTWLWNLILPPHIRLDLPKEQRNEEHS